MSRIELIITDLDNTLYDWVSFFAQAFEAMVDELHRSLGVERDVLLDEFKVLHQHYGNSEQPFVLLELPSVQKAFAGSTREELLRLMAAPLRAFDDTRRKTLRAYPTVEPTLRHLRRDGIKVIGHTEAIAANAYYRLRSLGLADCFNRLYALEGRLPPHPDPEHKVDEVRRSRLIRTVPRAERKPNPELLLDICTREGISPKQACYVGDSLTRDISMAKSAGLCAAWARYGTHYDRRHWATLVRVTHWTDEDVKREADLKRRFSEVQPDLTIDDFAGILPAFGLTLDSSRPAERRLESLH